MRHYQPAKIANHLFPILYAFLVISTYYFHEISYENRNDRLHILFDSKLLIICQALFKICCSKEPNQKILVIRRQAGFLQLMENFEIFPQ